MTDPTWMDPCRAWRLGREEAARLIDEHQVQHTSAGPRLVSRSEGNRDGLAYAAAIRALTSPPPVPAWPGAWRDVIVERRRQIATEGYLPEDDDRYRFGDLALAASVYALSSAVPPVFITNSRGENVPAYWPWPAGCFKPRGPRRDLVRAAALLLAEIERRDRAGLEAGGQP